MSERDIGFFLAGYFVCGALFLTVAVAVRRWLVRATSSPGSGE